MQETILIVEDEEDVAEMIRYNLEKESYRTFVAYSGAEALEAAHVHTPDLVLLDIMLPDLSGWEVCRILRDNAKSRSIPILMLTALSSEEAHIKGLSLGADDFLTKPFSIKELLLRIRKMIDRQHTLPWQEDFPLKVRMDQGPPSLSRYQNSALSAKVLLSPAILKPSLGSRKTQRHVAGEDSAFIPFSVFKD